jgi:chromosome partitioning protein
VDLVQKNLNPTLRITKVVLTMYDSRITLSGDVAKEVKRHFEHELCRTVIPRTVRLAEAPSFGQPITVFDPTSKGAIAYRALAEEILNG